MKTRDIPQPAGGECSPSETVAMAVARELARGAAALRFRRIVCNVVAADDEVRWHGACACRRRSRAALLIRRSLVRRGQRRVLVFNKYRSEPAQLRVQCVISTL